MTWFSFAIFDEKWCSHSDSVVVYSLSSHFQRSTKLIHVFFKSDNNTANSGKHY